MARALFPKYLNVEVTQKDIELADKERSARWRSSTCPIAQSIKRTYDLGRSIHDDHAVLRAWGPWGKYSLPREARAFVKAYDDGQPVAPIKFRMRKLQGLSKRNYERCKAAEERVRHLDIVAPGSAAAEGARKRWYAMLHKGWNRSP